MSDRDVEFIEVDPVSQAAVAAVSRYYEELAQRFPEGFDVEAYASGTTVVDEPSRFVLATRDGVPVACGTLRSLGDGIAEIKRMWVDPAVRGIGLGRRLLSYLESLASRDGYRAIRLDTNGSLIEAIALYDRAGYRRIPRYNDNPYAQLWFEKVLVDPSASLGQRGNGRPERWQLRSPYRDS